MIFVNDFRIGQELKIKSPKEWLSQFENKKINMCARKPY